MSSKAPRTRQKRKRKEIGIYMKNVLTRKVFLEFNLIGNNIVENIQKILDKVKEQGPEIRSLLSQGEE